MRTIPKKAGLTRLIVVFGLALSLPLGYLAYRSYRSLANEEAATLAYFAETLFEEIEASLADVIRREEARPIDAFGPGPEGAPLALPPREPYIRGYFQNNPDGTFQTPWDEASQTQPPDRLARRAELEEANRVFNRKRTDKTDRVPEEPGPAPAREKKSQTASFAGKYIDARVFQRSGEDEAQKDGRYSRRAQVTVKQAQNMDPAPSAKSEAAPTALRESASPAPRLSDPPETDRVFAARAPAAAPPAAAAAPHSAPESRAPEGVQVEIAPLQSVFIDGSRVFVFRRILIDGRIYRQGFVLQVDAFLAHLARTYFDPQPMAGFTRLRLEAADPGRAARTLEAGAAVRNARFVLEHAFAPPFGFFRATLSCEDIPPSNSRGTLNVVLAALAGIFLMGVGAIYLSARKIEDYSERQARFVSAVTHELKTPLTTIRMYIEMLEQGMARDPEREQDYFRVLHSEGERLSRLITNVLELSRLEKRHRRPEMKTGDFADVLEEIGRLMAEPLRQGGFGLECENRLARSFRYDREIMVQVLVNLIENSIKFGRASARREIRIRLREEGRRIALEVSDTGPGIPEGDLGKIFNDFYRSKDTAARAVGGTGIGLGLVRRFLALVGGEISAANNRDAGCTFTIRLPP